METHWRCIFYVYRIDFPCPSLLADHSQSDHWRLRSVVVLVQKAWSSKQTWSCSCRKCAALCACHPARFDQNAHQWRYVHPVSWRTAREVKCPQDIQGANKLPSIQNINPISNVDFVRIQTTLCALAHFRTRVQLQYTFYQWSNIVDNWLLGYSVEARVHIQVCTIPKLGFLDLEQDEFELKNNCVPNTALDTCVCVYLWSWCIESMADPRVHSLVLRFVGEGDNTFSPLKSHIIWDHLSPCHGWHWFTGMWQCALSDCLTLFRYDVVMVWYSYLNNA